MTKILYKITLFFYYFLGIFLIEKIPYLKKNFFPIWRFINKMFISNAAVLFTSFVLPIIFIILFGAFMQLNEVVPGIISQVPIIVLCINIPMLIVEFRESSILKRLASSHIKKHNILLAFVLYGMLVSFLSAMTVLIVSLTLYGNRTIAPAGSPDKQIALIESIKNVKIIGFLFSFLILLMLSSGIGILVASLSKNAMLAMAFGLFILIPGGFLSAQYLSPWIILNSKGMDYASYAFWQKYPSNLIIASFNGHNIFSLDEYIIISLRDKKPLIWLDGIRNISYFVGSFVASPIIFFIALKLFRWTNR